MRPTRRWPLTSLMTALFLGGCGDSTGPTIDDQALRVITDQIDSWVANGEVVGAEFLMIQRGEVVLNHAAGWKDRERQIPMATGTMFSIASIPAFLILMFVGAVAMGVMSSLMASV